MRRKLQDTPVSPGLVRDGRARAAWKGLAFRLLKEKVFGLPDYGIAGALNELFWEADGHTEEIKQAELGELIGCRLRRVQLGIDKMSKLGLVEPFRPHPRAMYRYRLWLPDWAFEAHADAHQILREAHGGAHQTVPDVHGGALQRPVDAHGGAGPHHTSLESIPPIDEPMGPERLAALLLEANRELRSLVTPAELLSHVEHWLSEGASEGNIRVGIQKTLSHRNPAKEITSTRAYFGKQISRERKRCEENADSIRALVAGFSQSVEAAA